MDRTLNLDRLRRGFNVGDRVAVRVSIPHGETDRVGVIKRWSWHGIGQWGATALPELQLRADVEFEKRGGSGSYCREFAAERLRVA